MTVSANIGTFNNLLTVGASSASVIDIQGTPTTYVLSDFYGNTVGSGSVSGSTLTLPAPGGSWPAGWYFLQFFLSGTMVDSLQITVVRADSNFIPVPSGPIHPGNAGDPGNAFFDVYMHGQTVMGPERYAVNDVTSPNTVTGNGIGVTLTDVEANIALEQGAGGYLNPSFADSARPRPPYCTVGPTTLATSGGYAAGVTAIVTALGPGTASDVTIFGGLNEPAGSFGQNAATSAAQYSTFAAAVHAAGIGALALGPEEVTFSPINSNGAFVPTNNNLANWLADITVPLDAFSEHFYNGYNGDIVVTDAWLAATWATLEAAGYAFGSIPFWITEMGAIESTWQTYVPRRLAQWLAQVLLTLDQWGCPKEQIYYETDSFGGQSLTSWILDYEGPTSPGEWRPTGTLWRVFSEEVFGKPYASKINFGTIGNAFYKANIYAGSTAKCVVVLAQGNPSDTITLRISDTGTITCSDWEGKLSTVTVSAGLITVPISDLPTYIRLSSTCTISLVDIGNGIGSSTNLAPLATAVSGSGAATPSRINDNIFQTGGYLPTPDTVFTSTATLPDYIELDWGSSVTLNKILLRQMSPWIDVDNASAMTAGTLQYWNGTSWVGCPTVAKNHWDTAGNYSNSSAVTSSAPGKVGQNAYAVTFWDNHWCHNIDFSTPVTTTKIRLTVTNASYGEIPDSTGATYAHSVFTGHTFFQQFNISEILALNNVPQYNYFPLRLS